MVASAEHTYFIYRTPMGRLSLASNGQAITRVAYGPMPLEGQQRATELTNRASSQILEYLSGKRRTFDVPVQLQGTEFQKAVWAEIAKIPYGEVRTYAQLAQALGKPKALQAVGQACGKNPVPILVPCHRVVGTGKLGGYSAGPLVDGQRIKRFLLKLEGMQLS